MNAEEWLKQLVHEAWNNPDNDEVDRLYELYREIQREWKNPHHRALQQLMDAFAKQGRQA